MKLSAFISLFIVFVLFCTGCSDEKKIPDKEFIPPMYSNSVIDTILKRDLDFDGISEYIVLNKDKNLDSIYDFFSFDCFEVFRWDSKEGDYRKIYSDTVYFGSSFSFASSIDKYRSVLTVTTYSGGNDTILATGLKVYGFSDTGIEKIFSKDMGMPLFKNMDNDTIQEIVTFNSIFFKHSDRKIKILDGIYKYSGDRYLDYTLQFQDYFVKENENLLKSYLKLKSDIRNIFDLSEMLVRISINSILAGKYNEAKRLFENEKGFIISVSEKQYLDILKILYENGLELDSEVKKISYDYFYKAKELIKTGKTKEAENILNDLLSIDPDFMDAYILLADLYLEKKDFDEAISYYQQAALFTTDDKRLYLGLGKSYLAKKDFVTSKEYFEKFILMDSLSAEAIKIKNILKQKEFN